jgi:hypothetical protein
MPGSDGPIPRTITFFGALPVMMKPAMETLSSIWTFSRVEIFSS